MTAGAPRPVALLAPAAEDAALIERWLHRAHVARWWGSPEAVLAALAADGAHPRQAIIEAAGEKVGLVLWDHPSRAELDEAGLTDLSTAAVDVECWSSISTATAVIPSASATSWLSRVR